MRSSQRATRAALRCDSMRYGAGGAAERPAPTAPTRCRHRKLADDDEDGKKPADPKRAQWIAVQVPSRALVASVASVGRMRCMCRRAHAKSARASSRFGWICECKSCQSAAAVCLPGSAILRLSIGLAPARGTFTHSRELRTRAALIKHVQAFEWSWADAGVTELAALNKQLGEVRHACARRARPAHGPRVCSSLTTVRTQAAAREARRGVASGRRRMCRPHLPAACVDTAWTRRACTLAGWKVRAGLFDTRWVWSAHVIGRGRHAHVWLYAKGLVRAWSRCRRCFLAGLRSSKNDSRRGRQSSGRSR